jgi:hypothetical protein
MDVESFVVPDAASESFVVQDAASFWPQLDGIISHSEFPQGSSIAYITIKIATTRL